MYVKNHPKEYAYILKWVKILENLMHYLIQLKSESYEKHKKISVLISLVFSHTLMLLNKQFRIGNLSFLNQVTLKYFGN